METNQTSEASAAPVPSNNEGNKDKRTVDALLRVHKFIASMGDLDLLLDQIMQESKNVMSCDASALMLYDEESDQLFFKVAQGPKSDQIKTIRLEMGQGIAGACAQERKTQVVQDVSRDARHFKGADKKSEYHTRNILAAPMVRGPRLIGVLEVLNKQNDEPFTDDDIHLLEIFAGEAAAVVENAMLLRDKMEAERLAAIGVAVAGISHYIKNILAGLWGSSRLIETGLDRDNFGLVKEAWPILQRANKKISNLVQDMLSYSKEREPNWQEGNINSLLGDIHQTQRERANELGVILLLKPDQALGDTQFDPDAIHDALLNLAGNAIEACADVKDARVTIQSELLADQKLIYVTIADNGPGIPEDIQEKIFRPFFSTKGSKGTGLGLAVTQKAIKEHGGQLVLESEAGKGATFRVQLPLGPPAKA